MNGAVRFQTESSRRWMISVKFWYAALAFYVLILGFLSLNPWVRPASGDDIFSPDKIVHAFAYGGLAIIVFFCLTKARNSYIRNTLRVWIAAMFIAALFGIFMEVAQSLFTVNRAGSLADAVANIIGATLGYIVYRSAKFIRSIMAT